MRINFNDLQLLYSLHFIDYFFKFNESFLFYYTTNFATDYTDLFLRKSVPSRDK